MLCRQVCMLSTRYCCCWCGSIMLPTTCWRCQLLSDCLLCLSQEAVRQLYGERQRGVAGPQNQIRSTEAVGRRTVASFNVFWLWSARYPLGFVWSEPRYCSCRSWPVTFCKVNSVHSVVKLSMPCPCPSATHTHTHSHRDAQSSNPAGQPSQPSGCTTGWLSHLTACIAK